MAGFRAKIKSRVPPGVQRKRILALVTAGLAAVWLLWRHSRAQHLRRFPGAYFGQLANGECLLSRSTRLKPEDTMALRRTITAPWLQGRLSGIELGALHTTFEVPANTTVKFVDSKSLEDLRKVYPELAGVNLVAPDIIDHAETLATIADGSQDFALASHVLEHTSSPLTAVKNMLRVVKRGGVVVLVLPMKCEMWDRPRVLTAWEHLLSEYVDYPAESERNRREHFREFVWSRQLEELGAGVEAQATTRGLDAEAARAERWAAIQQAGKLGTVELDEARVDDLLAQNYAVHFHTWDQATFASMLQRLAAGEAPAFPAFEVREFVAHKYEAIAVLQRL